MRTRYVVFHAGRRAARGSSGFGVVLLLILVAAFVAQFLWWVIAAAVVLAAAYVAASIMRGRDDQRAIARGRPAAIAARADQQHQWLAEGDNRGVYGEYPPAAMGGC